MPDYLPLDLDAHLDAAIDLLPDGARAPVGKVVLRGLPFQIGPADPAAAGRRLLARGGDHGNGTVTIPIGQAAKRVIVCHVLLESDIWNGGSVGNSVATYIFRIAGTDYPEPIRERFEIAIARPPWGQWPFRCFADTGDGTTAREQGNFGASGFRLTEVSFGNPMFYYLWVWTPPVLDAVIESLTIVPAGPPFAIAGITLCQLDEDPIPRDAALPVRIDTLDNCDRRGNLEIEVDRGAATYPFALPATDFAGDPLSGWGQAQSQHAAPATANVMGSPSATVTVKHGGQVIGQVNWGEVTSTGAADDGRVRVTLVESGRNWVHTKVVDADTGETLPCRIHFRSPDGVPYQPHGHHPYAASNLGSWHYDVGGDVRLGQITYAYIDGTCQGWLPRGEVWVDVARGYEHQPLRAKVTIGRGQRELTLQLKRVRDMNAERYFSGDSHVHFLSTVGAHTEAAGEGLNVVNLLQSQWGHLFTNTEEFCGEPSVRAGQRTIVYAAQENRQHILGHLTLLNQKRPIMPWCTDGPSEAELGGNLEITLSRWADECHAQGGTVILPHIPNPNGEPPTLIATGRVDAVEFLRHDFYYRNEYYRYLNAGYRLPIVGGTDKMTQDVPVGIYRTYAWIPPEEEFTYDNWCKAVRSGNTFHSGGPLLTFTVDGQMPGSTVRLKGNGGTVHVAAVATSIFPIRELQIVRQGKVVASVTEPAGTHRLELHEDLAIDAHTWLAARVADAGQDEILHHDGWHRGVMAHTSPVYLAVGGDYDLIDPEVCQYMLTLIDGTLSYIRETAHHYPHDRERVTHQHGVDDHIAWLEEPFHEAAEAIHRRLHEHGIAH